MGATGVAGSALGAVLQARCRPRCHPDQEPGQREVVGPPGRAPPQLEWRVSLSASGGVKEAAESA